MKGAASGIGIFSVRPTSVTVAGRLSASLFRFVFFQTFLARWLFVEAIGPNLA